MKQGEGHLVVIGGGAAGFFCAVNAARLSPSLKVTLLEKSGKLLQKVKVSGGGRCNTTHHLLEISALSKCYPRGEKFVKKAFHHFNPSHTIEWFQQRGVRLKREADGRMFPTTDSSQTIIDCLLREAEQYGVNVHLHAAVQQLESSGNNWRIALAGGKEFFAEKVCVAVGGYARSEQFQWIIQHTGHHIVEPVPSLFTFNTPGHPITRLMGVAHPARVKIAGTRFESEGPVLITHWGLSGPAILRTSAFAARHLAACQYMFDVVINWMPAFNEHSLREKVLEYRQQKGSRKVINTEWVNLPLRLWEFLLEFSGIDLQQRWADLPAALQNKLIKVLCAFEISARGKTAFKEEFVTAGGIDIAEIDPNTMQSRLAPGLYFAGEIMDVDGITGGFNFQHAWTSGMLAALHIAQSVK